MNKIVKCPRCGKQTDITANPFRPFCSERCKLVDLGNWLSDNYRISVKDAIEKENQEPVLQKDPEKK